MNNEELGKVLVALSNAIDVCGTTIKFLLDRVECLEQEVCMLRDKLANKKKSI